MGDNPATFTDKEDWPKHPVDNVSWNDCQLFIEKLNDLGLGKFRLPTEAEWEYACRAGTTTRFYWGTDSLNRVLHDHAWGFSRAEGRSHPVGLKKPNNWELYDMSGNVWEWCEDWYADYSTEPLSNPRGPKEAALRVIRGGSWRYVAGHCRAAYRGRYVPRLRNGNLGFRVAAVPPGKTSTSQVQDKQAEPGA